MAAALAFWGPESRARAGGVGALRAPAPVTMDSFFFGIEEGGVRVVLGRGEEGVQGVPGMGGGWGGSHAAAGAEVGADPCPDVRGGLRAERPGVRRSGRVNGGPSVHGHT